MEDVSDIYELPYNPELPVICMDEKSYQLLDHSLDPLPTRPGDFQKTDSEYMRKGTCSIFVFVEPLAGWRHSNARYQRRAIDWAEEIKYILTECYPVSNKIILIMDNLNTHAIGFLYKRYPDAEARSYVKRVVIHYTPKHGSWLNIAEIEWNVMTRQCLSRRISDLSRVNSELSAWE